MFCRVNANGKQMPSMFIVNGNSKMSLYTFNTTEDPKDIVWTFQKNAWITDETGEHWFLRNSGGLERLQLLISDDHSNRASLAIIERAIEERFRTSFMIV